MVVGIFHHLAGQGDVLLVGLAGTVDHDGGEAAVDAALAELKGVAVIEMHADGQVEASGLLGVLDGGLDELHEVDVLGIGPGALAHLQDEGGVLLDGGLSDALNDLHVVHVERADGVAAVVGLLEHLFCGDDCHKSFSFVCIFYFPQYISNDGKNQL